METKAKDNFRTIFSHMGLWLLYIIYQAVSYSWENTDALSFKLPPQIIAVIVPVTIILTYINLKILVPSLYSHQKYGIYLISVIALLLLGGLCMRYFTYQFVVPWERFHDLGRYRQENKDFWIPVRILRISFEPIPIMAITMAISNMQNTFYQEKKLREIELERLSAEMKLLKAQINPHFLFNTLNSLYALTLKGSEKSPDVVLRLSELMHYMLYETKAESVKLTEEISYIENYINIEQMRFSDRVNLSFKRVGILQGKKIAPLLLLPFVENAFKHGIEEGDGWINIELKVTEEIIFFQVENSIPQHVAKKIGGQGLDNLTRRLNLIYGNKCTISLIEGKQIFVAGLKISL